MLRFSSLSGRSLVGAGVIVLIAGQAAIADVLVHLDASVPDSLIDDNGVVTWLDQSGNGLNATDDGSGGGIFFPNATPFPSGLEGVDFDTAFSKQRMRLLDPTDAGVLFDQSAADAEGFSIFIVAQGEKPSPGGWNDIVGNSSVVSNGFLMRWNTDNGVFHASLDNGSVNATSQNNSPGQDNYSNGEPFVIAMNYDPITNGGELTLASTLNNYIQVFFVPPLDFSAGGNPLWLGSTTSGARFFDGKIGEVLIHDAALTPEEFAAELAELGEKWVPAGPDCEVVELACEVVTGDAGPTTVQGSLSARLAGGGDCDCTTVDVFIDDLPSGSVPVGVDGVIEVPIPEGCAGDGHVLEVMCRNSLGGEGASGTCAFSCPAVVTPCDTVELVCAVIASDDPPEVGDAFLHLDASVPDSLIDDNGSITWLDQSGNDRHAIDDGPGGGISFPNATPFPSGLEGVDFDTTFSRQRMQLLDSFDALTIFDQSSPDAEGFAIFIAAQGEEPSPGEWNDIIGNSTVISTGFLMRWNTQNGVFHASLDDGSGVPTLEGAPNNYNNGEPFVIAINYDPTTGGGEATLASTLNRYRQMFAVPPLDFTSGGNPLWLGTSTSGSRYFDGKIGEVLIYDRALTSEEFEWKLAELGEKWIDLTREVTVRATVSAQLAGGGDCGCPSVDVFIDDLLVGSLPVDADGVIEVPLPDGCDGDDEHVLEVTCRNSFGDEGGSGTCAFSCPGDGTPFIRGDVDANAELAISDSVRIFNFLFAGNAEVTCMDAADASDQGSVNLASGVYILNYLFAGNAEPPAPFPDCGEDTTEDAGGTDLGCEFFAACQ